MNQMILHGKWRQARGVARENWGRLTQNDSQRFGGKADRLIGSFEERFGHTRVRAERDFKDFLSQYPIPGAGRLVAQQKSRILILRRPWLMLAVVSALIMLIRFLASNKGSNRSGSQSRAPRSQAQKRDHQPSNTHEIEYS